MLSVHLLRGLPRFAEINPSLSAVLRIRLAFLSASVRCAPAGLIFAYGASLRWSVTKLPVTDNWSILLHLHN